MQVHLGNKRFGFALVVLFLIGFFGGICVKAAELETNPNISWTKDHMAFTTDRGETDYVIYAVNSSVRTGTEGTLQAPMEGEHYYRLSKKGTIPVGKWVVKKVPGMCVHDAYGVQAGWHGLTFGTKKCGKSFKCGWVAVCADCKEEIPMLFYMDRDTAQSMGSLREGVDYYYLCPFCSNLEQGRPVRHDCKGVSANKYWVAYDKNHPDASGYMEESVFYYNNASLYEGALVTGERRLKKNTYQCQGCYFVGWNTKADGSGEFFADGQGVLNLSQKDKDIITLYAVWETSKSTLHIDPNKGSYNGENGIYSITRPYGSMITLSAKKVVAPVGHTVSFEGNGANPVADIVSVNELQGWSEVGELKGRLIENKYYFYGKQGDEDTLRAVYKERPIVLPKPKRDGWSFGGWYEDSKCTKLAGREGDSYLTTKNRTLYAKWVNLVLYSRPNYTARAGKGAVDLWWKQKDDLQKAYMVYQSEDNRQFSMLSEEGEQMEGNFPIVQCSFQGETMKYSVQESGFYSLTAKGAQGENCASKLGGKGGRAKGSFYLKKGDVLTVKVGGQNGYNNGGKATEWGNGGGSTTIVSQKKGLLLIGAGGGGATPGTNGGAGGKETGLRPDGVSTGQKGSSGGGGGKVGGKAGAYSVHTHDEDCYEVIPIVRNEMEQPKGTYSAKVFHMHTIDDCVQPLNGDFKIGGHNQGSKENMCRSNMLCEGIPLKNIDKLSLVMEMCAEGGNQGAFLDDPLSLSISFFDQANKKIYQVNKSQVREIPYTRTDDPLYAARKREYETAGESVSWTVKNVQNTSVVQYVKFCVDIALPKECTSLGFSSVCITNNMLFHYQSQELKKFVFTGEKREKLCPYEEGEIVENKQSYGGSNFVSDNAFDIETSADVNKGNGSALIQLLCVACDTGESLDAVEASDRNAPDSVDEENMVKEALKENLVRVSWEKPKDNGSVYYHKVESKDVRTGKLICTSNTTKDEIITGLKGYYYLWNKKENTLVTEKNGTFLKENYLEYHPLDGAKYLHLAAVDKAGNVSETIHVLCGTTQEEIYWHPRTTQLLIDSVVGEIDYGGIWQKEEKTWYVKADGVTPFRLGFLAQLEGRARKDYQIDQMIITSQYDEGSQVVNVKVPLGNPSAQSEKISPDGIDVTVLQKGALKTMAYHEAIRENGARNLSIAQGVVLQETFHAKQVELYPSAGATSPKGTVFSTWEEDCNNGIYIIGDALPPVIYGSDVLENLSAGADMETLLKTPLDFMAYDDLSGVASFMVKLVNAEDYTEITLHAENDGHVRFCMEQDFPDWTGDLDIILEAIDHVGNLTKLKYPFTGCGLTASLSRILEPHDPVFKSGESGILHIEAWGNVDKVEVEFPTELTELNPQLNRVYVYETKKHLQLEELQFMVPLYTPSAEGYQVIVRAYKAGTDLHTRPCTCTFAVTDSVLNELRTRLR